MTASTMNATDTARELFREAYEHRYTWDKNFPGFTADAALEEGGETHRAKVQVNRDLKIEVTEATSEEGGKKIREQIWEIVIHRVRRSFEEVHGKNTFAIEAEDNGTVTLAVGGGAAGDRYKVRDRQVVMVHRHIHGVVVTIDTLTSYEAGEEGYLPETYTSIYSDPQTGEPKSGRMHHQDRYMQVGGYHVLAERTVTTETPAGPQTMTFRLENLVLAGA